MPRLSPKDEPCDNRGGCSGDSRQDSREEKALPEPNRSESVFGVVITEVLNQPSIRNAADDEVRSYASNGSRHRSLHDPVGHENHHGSCQNQDGHPGYPSVSLDITLDYRFGDEHKEVCRQVRSDKQQDRRKHEVDCQFKGENIHYVAESLRITTTITGPSEMSE